MKITDRPRVHRLGPNLIQITVVDESTLPLAMEINLSQAWAMAQEILEIVFETREAAAEATTLNPVFVGILKRFEGGPK